MQSCFILVISCRVLWYPVVHCCFSFVVSCFLFVVSCDVLLFLTGDVLLFFFVVSCFSFVVYCGVLFLFVVSSGFFLFLICCVLWYLVVSYLLCPVLSGGFLLLLICDVLCYLVMSCSFLFVIPIIFLSFFHHILIVSSLFPLFEMTLLSHFHSNLTQKSWHYPFQLIRKLYSLKSLRICEISLKKFHLKSKAVKAKPCIIFSCFTCFPLTLCN